jgi:hypothetical protein
MLMAIASLALTGGAVSVQAAADDSVTAAPLTLQAEALVWWQKASPTPVPIITDGLYGQPGTNVLLGGGDMDTNPSPGLRLTASYALDKHLKLEGSFLYLGERSSSASVESSGQIGSVDLLVPFYDVTQNRENVTELSYSPTYRGSARQELTNSMMGLEAGLAWALPSSGSWKVDMIGGLRWLQLKEGYAINTSSQWNPPNPADIWDTHDSFDTSNNFYGVQIGARTQYDQDDWFVGGTAKLGLGVMKQQVDISGSLVTNDFTNYGATQTYPGGYFALPTNIGSHSQNEFAVVPEIQLNIGYRLTPTATIFAAYSFLYANNVVRPGNQINRNVNPTQSVSYVGEPPVSLEGAAQPQAAFNTSSYWAQGISVGLNVQF